MPQGSQAPRAMWARTEPPESLETRAFQVCKVLLDSLGQRVPLVPKAKMGALDTLDREENWASKVRQVHLDQPVSWALREKLERQGLWVKGGPQAPLDLLVNKVFRAWKAERASRETWGRQDPLGRKDPLDPGDSPVPKELQETWDLLV